MNFDERREDDEKRAGKAVDNTSMSNKEWKAVAIDTAGISASEAFNRLSPVPSIEIDLGDGRELCITEWTPYGDINTCMERLDVAVVGFIRAKG